MVMVWSEVVQCERHRNETNEGHQNRTNNSCDNHEKKTSVGFPFFSFLVCFTGQKETSTASLLRGQSKHKNVAHIPPIQGYLWPSRRVFIDQSSTLAEDLKSGTN
jgi:hypothetical protein